jgi:hypothetical protein
MIYGKDHRYSYTSSPSSPSPGAAPPRCMRMHGEACITRLTEAVLDSCELSMQVYPNTASDSIQTIRRMQEQERVQAQPSNSGTGEGQT